MCVSVLRQAVFDLFHQEFNSDRWGQVVQFNNAPERTMQECLTVMRYAAKLARMEEEGTK